MAEQTINVARQETLENIDSKIDTLDTVADNIYSKVDSEVAAIKTKTDLIGATGDTGGSTTAGTIMGKLNALLTSWTSTRAGYIDRLANGTYGLDKIKADTTTNNTGSKTGILSQKLSYLISLLENTTYGLSAIKTAISSSGGGSKVYKPSTAVLSTVLNKEVANTTFDGGSSSVLYFGKFVPQYSGVVKVTVQLAPSAVNYYGTAYGIEFGVGSHDVFNIHTSNGSCSLGAAYRASIYNMLGALEAATPATNTLVNTGNDALGSMFSPGSDGSLLYALSLEPYSTNQYYTKTFYLPVNAGKPLYFMSIPDYVEGARYHVKCKSIVVYGTAS